MSSGALRARGLLACAALGVAWVAAACGGDETTPPGGGPSGSGGVGQGGGPGTGGAGGAGGAAPFVCPGDAGGGGQGGAGGEGGEGGEGGGSEGVFGFTRARRYHGGNAVVVLRDMDGDGDRDLIVVNTLGGFVSVQLGAGDGSFKESHRTYLQDHLPAAILRGSLAVADFNGDGRLDLAVPGGDVGIVVVRGAGCGMFAPPLAYPTTIGAGGAVAAVDLDSDGHMDVVTAHGYGGSVDVLLNDGDGTGALSMSQQASIGDGHRFEALAAADVDGDGLIDVVAADRESANAYLFKGAGGGALSPALELPAKRARSIALGDLTGDGRPEIILGSSGSGGSGLGVLTNNGDGTFQPIVLSNDEREMNIRDLADLDGDGVPEVIGHDSITGELLAVTSAAGSLAPATTLAAGWSARGVAAADVDGDAIPDLVVGNEGPGLAFLAGNGDGTFQAPAMSGLGAGGRVIAVGDLDGDSAPEVILGGRPSMFTVLQSAAGGVLSDAGAHEVAGRPRQLLAVDANGDGLLDVLSVNQCSSPCRSLELALGNGDGSFQPTLAPLDDFPVTRATAGDVDGDGDIDVLATGDTDWGSWMMRNNGDGTFTSGGAGTFDAVGFGDFDGDGTLDLAVSSGEYAAVLRGDGDGTYQFGGQWYPLGGTARGIAVGELNGDGYADIVVTLDSLNENIMVFYSAGDGQHLTPAEIYLNDPGIHSLLVADLDGDGWQDVALLAGSRLLVLRNSMGFFQAGPVISGLRDPASLAAADIDADGHLDLLVTSAVDDDLVVLRNTL